MRSEVRASDAPELAARDTELEAVDPRGAARGVRLAALFLVLVGAGAFANGVGGPFVFDDYESVINNPNVRSLWPLTDALWAPPGLPVSRRPVVSLSLALNYALGGEEPAGYHVANILVHLLAALALFGVVRRTLLLPALRARFAPRATAIACASALLWMVHPLQTECVTYVTQRTQSLMGLFFLLTLYAAIRARGAERPGLWSALSVVCCFLGMASKEPMVTAPLIVLCHDLLIRSEPVGAVLRRRRGLYLGLGAAWGLLAALVLFGPALGPLGLDSGLSPWSYALNQCLVLTDYLRLTFWPSGFALDYGFAQDLSLGDVLPQAVLIVALLVATVVSVARAPRASFAAVWFFVILGPSSSFVPIPTEIGAERRMYLPLAGIVVLVVLAGAALLHRGVPRRAARATGAAATALVAALLIGATIQRNRDYLDPVRLWQTAVAATPVNDRAHYNLGNALRNAGRTDEAIVSHRRAIALNDGQVEARSDLGLLLTDRGQLDEAIELLRSAVQLAPDHANAHNNLGRALGMRGALSEALTHLRRAIALAPHHATAHNNLGNTLMLRGDAQGALASFGESLRLDPSSPMAHGNLARLLESLGRRGEAIEHYRRAVELEPDNAFARAGLERLGAAQRP